MNGNAEAAGQYRKAQAASLILLTKTLLVSIRYFTSQRELDREAALAILEGKWPRGVDKLLNRLHKDFPHYFDEDGKARAFHE